MGSSFPRYTQELPRILYRERKANSRRHLIFGYVVLVDVVSNVSALQLQACWDIASLPSKAGMGILPESFPQPPIGSEQRTNISNCSPPRPPLSEFRLKTKGNSRIETSSAVNEVYVPPTKLHGYGYEFQRLHQVQSIARS